MAVTDIIWPLLVRGLIKPLASLVFSGMRGPELLYQYVIVFTSCFVSECYDFQIFFFFFSNVGPSSLDSDIQINFFLKSKNYSWHWSLKNYRDWYLFWITLVLGLERDAMSLLISQRNYFRITSRKRHCVFIKLTREIRVGHLHDDFTCHNWLIRGYIRSWYTGTDH